MRALVERFRRDPGLALLALALGATIAIYAPTLGRGLVNYDDTWLVHDNFILQHPSWAGLHGILFDTSTATRFVLGAEYLPVRDLSIMLDGIVWGDWYGGLHVTNLIVYLLAIGVWFRVLAGFGLDRKLAGLAMLFWALHPSHAESVAWISERKGLLGVMFAGVAALGYARFRAAAGTTRWLVVAMLAAVLAVWSKAPSAFAIAALAGLELALPERRQSWRRSLIGLGAIAVVAAAAFAPVVLVATKMAVVGTDDHAPAGWLAMVVGLHGFYLELGAMAIRNAASYEIGTLGPSAFQLTIGAIGLVVALATMLVPARGRWRPPAALRAASVIWLLGWLPASRLVLPLRNVLVADRYLLFATLGIALALAVGITRLASARARNALVGVLVIASALRTLDAQASWSSPRALWSRAVESNPDDRDAWAMYAEALDEDDEPALAMAAVEQGLARGESARLLLRKALLVLGNGDRAAALPLFRRAAEAGDPRAMSNLALLEQASQPDDALAWARRGAAAAPMSAHAQRSLGKVALAAHPDEALPAFELAYRLEPSIDNHYNLGLAYLALHRAADAIPHFEACVADDHLGARARAALAEAHRQLGG